MKPETLEKLLDFVDEYREGTLPAPVQMAAERDLLDTLGCIVGGISADIPRRLLQAVASAGGARSIIGTARRASSLNAARLMSIAGVWLDLDTGLYKHPASQRSVPTSHSTVHILPAMFADPSIDHCASGRALRYFALAYEVASRVASATVLRSGVHPHGVAVTVGPAIALALLRDYDRARLRRAVQLTSALPIAPPLRAALKGGQVRNLFAATGVENAWLAARLAEELAWERVVSPAFALSRVAGDCFDDDQALKGLGTEWFMQRGYMKMHACCRYLHPALDALEDLRGDQTIEAGEVSTIHVRTFGNAVQLDDPSPVTDLGAKFSVPWGVAASVVLGHTGVSAFSTDALSDPRIRDLAGRIEVTEESAYTAQLPDTRRTSVELMMSDGRRIFSEAVNSRGDPSQPFTDEQVAKKFLSLAQIVMNKDQSHRVLQAVKEMAQREYPMSELIAATVPPGDSGQDG